MQGLDPRLAIQKDDPVNEMMTIISGALIMTNAEGVEETFGPGEVVFVPKGSKLTWQITERLKKYYMTSSQHESSRRLRLNFRWIGVYCWSALQNDRTDSDCQRRSNPTMDYTVIGPWRNRIVH